MDDPDETAGRHAAILDLLSDDTRLGIVLALAEHQRTHPESPSLAFADLRRRVEGRATGNFSYHLDHLRGRFVEKVDGAYRLTYRGQYLAGVVAAGIYDESDEFRASVDGRCPDCDGSLELVHADGVLEVRCPDGHCYPRIFLPRSQIEARSVGELTSVVAMRSQQASEQLLAGTCPLCTGPVDPSLVPGDGPEQTLMLAGSCRACGLRVGSALGPALARRPPVVRFFDERGIDVRDLPPWSEQFHEERGLSVTVPEAPPPSARVAFRVDADVLTLALDEDGTVRAVDRSSG